MDAFAWPISACLLVLAIFLVLRFSFPIR